MDPDDSVGEKAGDADDKPARDFPSRFLCEDVDAHQNIQVVIGDLVTERQHITWCTDEGGGVI